ncbi:unnamed protein product [Auanema sp. JU1783]|nr:unnamed protein product [Auanema sp. JU1783]
MTSVFLLPSIFIVLLYAAPSLAGGSSGVELTHMPDVPKPDNVIVAKNSDLKSKTDNDDEDEDDDEDFYTFGDEDDAKQDSYFTKIDLSHEHDRFMDALDRLEKKYRSKIDKVMKEWYELKGRYTTMKDKDPKQAEKMKSEMNVRFQSTVNSLEEEHKKARHEIRTVHDERVSSALNEKKRIATHEYRRALVNQVMRPNRIEVLKALKKYIRAEEKDRLHQLNKYRHLLNGAPDEAKEFKPSLLHKLHEIDLRINATLSMLRDFPDIEQQIQAIIMGYWKDFRHENTPSIDDIEINQTNSLDADAKNKKLIDVYTETYRKEHNLKTVTTTTTTTAAPKVQADKEKALDLDKDSEEDSDDYYEDEADEEVEKVKIQIKPAVTKVDERPEDRVVEVHRKFTELKPIVTTSEESESESTEEDQSDEIVEKEIRVNIEPIITETEYSANIRESLMNDIKKRAVDSQVALSQLLFLFGSILCLALIGLTILKRRNARHGFVEVDVYTSEERHLAGMQVNGYENPTYSFFDSKN